MELATEFGRQAYRIIQERWPDFTDRLKAENNQWCIEKEVKGTQIVLSVDGYRLFSAWDPKKEAALQCAHLPQNSSSITVFGIGAGLLPSYLLERLKPDASLNVVPMNRSLFINMLDYVDMTSWLANPSVNLQEANSVNELPEHFVITPSVLSLAEPDSERLRDVLRQWLSNDHMASFQADSRSLVQTNLSANLSLSSQDKDIAALLNAGVLSPVCVVVGAGPSLEFAYSDIRNLVTNGASVLCVDAALVPLLNAGIQPDITVCIDPQPSIKHFFDALSPKAQDTELVYFPVIDPAIVEQWPCQRWRAVSRDSLYDQYQTLCPTTALFSSGSVIHPTVDIAVRSGAHSVYMAGVDFCYPFESTHASGVVVGKQSSLVAQNHICVRNYLDQSVPSQMNFVSYYRDLENYVSWCIDKGRRFFNLGHHSARIANVEWLPLS